MDDDIFFENESSQYGDGVLLNEYRGEFALVAAKRKDGKVFMEWVFPQKRDGSKEPMDKSLPWKIKLGPKEEAIKALKYFLGKLEGGVSPSDDTPEDTWEKGRPPGDLWEKGGPPNDDVPF